MKRFTNSPYEDEVNLKFTNHQSPITNLQSPICNLQSAVTPLQGMGVNEINPKIEIRNMKRFTNSSLRKRGK